MIFPIRFKLVFLSFLAVFICYIDRVNISVAIIPMQKEFGWTESQVGLIFSSFYFGYMISMILGGLLADKFGGKKVLAYGVVLWSLFTILTPAFAYNGFFYIILIRVLLGLGEGITFPSWHSLYARWIRFRERTRSIAITNSGITAGTVFALAVTAIIIDRYSWEMVFYSYGLLGFVWLIFWSRDVTSLPENHKKITKKELDLIKKEAPAKEKALNIPFIKLIKNKPFSAIIVATFCNNWVLFTFISYLPKFANDSVAAGGLGIDLGSSKFLLITILPALVSFISIIFGGFLADFYIKRGIRVILVRKFFNSIGFFGPALLLIIVPHISSIILIMILLCSINLFIGLGAGGFGVNHADLAPKYTGSLVGISGSIGMIAAVISSYVAGQILFILGSWQYLFYVSSFFLIFGGGYYLLYASTSKQFD